MGQQEVIVCVHPNGCQAYTMENAAGGRFLSDGSWLCPEHR